MSSASASSFKRQKTNSSNNNTNNNTNNNVARINRDPYVTTLNGGRKFIGGAAAVRQQVRRKGTRILRPGEQDVASQQLPKGLSTFESYFACLLRSSIDDFIGNKPKTHLKEICNRINLNAPKQQIQPMYKSRHEHFQIRAALVLEESRFAISQGLLSIKKTPLSGIIRVILQSSELKQSTGHTSVCVMKESPLTPDELASLRPASVLAFLPKGLTKEPANVILGCVLPTSREDIITSNAFTIKVFRPMSRKPNSEWDLIPITSLLSEHRKFEACTSNYKIPFLPPLLGHKPPEHTRFEIKNDDDDDNDDDQCNDVKIKIEDGVENDDNNNNGDDVEIVLPPQIQEMFHLPQLNPTQEKAATSFLQSDSGSITLIQGPPGTGKTTLLVSVICRYLMDSIMQNQKRRLMVCAPTNKAISVLCTRFLNHIEEGQTKFNVVLVGDDDKLLEEDNSGRGAGKKSTKLRSIFLYSWIKTVTEDYITIKSFLAKRYQSSRSAMCQLSMHLEHRLARCLSFLSTPKAPAQITSFLKDGSNALENIDISDVDIIQLIDRMLQDIQSWKKEEIWDDVIGSADVIFCTLTSAGCSILKRSSWVVDDLIVDEAAAATEPELYIPLHCVPKRLLAVGDPKQLPATVLSTHAAKLGLSTSLHERLMYNCDWPHIMLDTQYRMKPALSSFPSTFFYAGKLVNGENVVSPTYKGTTSIVNNREYSFIQVNGFEQQSKSGSYENEAEAHVVVDLLLELEAAAAKNRRNNNNNNTIGQQQGWNAADKIRVITFYQAQVKLIQTIMRRKRISGVIVATVDSSQGCEAEIVILSFVRSNSRDGKSRVGFLQDDRRMNVALTRAKHQMVCVGNVEGMKNVTESLTVFRLAVDANERNCIISQNNNNNNNNRRNHNNNNNNGWSNNHRGPPRQRQQQQNFGNRKRKAKYQLNKRR